MVDKKLISIITPVYNEQENIRTFYEAMKATTDRLAEQYDVEFVFTDNCSTDATFAILEDLAAQDTRIRVFRFSRNFGYQKSILTGYSKARGHCAVEYDCDLQDPPELLAELLKHWEDGYKIVYGIRSSRPEGVLVTLLRRIFYWVINHVSKHELPQNAGDFMLIDKCVLEQLKKRRDQHPYVRGIIFGMGFKRIGVPYSRNARTHGTSKFPFSRMFGLAIDGIISQSMVPLRLASYIGITIAFIAMLLSGWYLFGWMFLDYSLAPGFTSTILLILFSIGLNAIFLGIIGEYLLRIYLQLCETSLTIIDQSIDPHPH